MFLHHLTLGMSEDYQIYVYTSRFNAEKDVKTHNGAIIKLIPLKANGFQSIFYDFFSMLDASVRGADYILVLGVSGGIFFPFFKAFKSTIILNPDGAEYKRSKFNIWTKGFLKLSESLGVKFSDRLIADNKIISNDLAIHYGLDSTVIEYGGDHAISVDLRESTASLYDIQKGNYAFKVCRIVPENNIVMILEAFSKSNHKLIIIGNWDNSQFGIEIRKKYRHFENLILLDPIYDQVSLDELRSNCRLYVHGHSVGGTNPSLVEAMYLGLPCLVYDVSYNRETTEEAAIYFSSETEIRSSLDQLWSCDDDLISIGRGLHDIARRRYSWTDIIAKYRHVIENGE